MIIVHSIWLKEVIWFGPSNPSTLFQHNLTTYATPKFVLDQCDQIGRFIALWINFQRLWQQLFCPNKHHLNAIFWKVSKLFISKWNNFWATFMDIWQLFTGHTVHDSGFFCQNMEGIYYYHRTVNADADATNKSVTNFGDRIVKFIRFWS